ncbi:hypothetical protein VTN00DRAFT_5778 [Thermoascus crustaceus]|uniref:uncharacterized protein n=1 Tax=Thermoascus crustaceus TaxID=5088 RepID=UPI0037437575
MVSVNSHSSLSTIIMDILERSSRPRARNIASPILRRPGFELTETGRGLDLFKVCPWDQSKTFAPYMSKALVSAGERSIHTMPSSRILVPGLYGHYQEHRTGDLQTATKGHGRGHGRGNGRGRGKGNHGQNQTEVQRNTSTPILVPAQITPSAQAATVVPQGLSMQGAETPNTPAAAITAALEVYTISVGVVPQTPTPILTVTEGTETVVIGFDVLGGSSGGMSSASVVASSAAISPAIVEASSPAAIVTSSPAVLPDDDDGDCGESPGVASAVFGASSVVMTLTAVGTSSAAVSPQNNGASSTAVASPAAAAASSPVVSPPSFRASPVAAVPAASAAVVPGTDPNACDCSCLCPYDSFNEPAVNVPMGSPGVTPQALPTTFLTVVTPALMSVGVETSSNPPIAVSSVAAPQANTVAASSSIGAQSSRTVGVQSSRSGVIQSSNVSAQQSSSIAVQPSSSIAAQPSSSAMVQASSSIARSTAVSNSPAATTMTPAADQAPSSAASSSNTPASSSLTAAAVTTPPEPAATTSSTSETATVTTDPSADAEAAPIDINTVSLHSALTIRLGGRDVEPEPTAS